MDIDSLGLRLERHLDPLAGNFTPPFTVEAQQSIMDSFRKYWVGEWSFEELLHECPWEDELLFEGLIFFVFEEDGGQLMVEHEYQISQEAIERAGTRADLEEDTDNES